jgi:hypothetical protein
MRGYCLAVRSALTDDGRAPLGASRLKLQERLTQISDSLTRIEQKKPSTSFETVATSPQQGLAAHGDPLASPQRCLRVGVPGGSHLANHEQQTGARVRQRYLAFVAQMQAQKASLGTLSTAIEHFAEITEHFAAGLFHCYDVPDLPRTNNDLEHCFGVARAHERRATGRRGAIPGVVVRGSVRVVALLVNSQENLQVADLQPTDYQQWRDLRAQFQSREEARRQRFRFRKDPAVYLAALETQLLR